MRKIPYLRTGVTTLLVTAVLVTMSGLSGASILSDEATFRPNVEIVRVSGQFDIDGELNEPGWYQAPLLERFVERYPGDNTPPAVPTRVSLAYDKNNLYVAFVCLDNPELIRATMCQRDEFNNDDAVCVLLDTYGDASWAYQFHVNPYGVQKDLLWTSIGGEDYGFDIIWHSAAKVTDSGYQVEMAIPFSSMRFPNTPEQVWRIDFYRHHPRETQNQYSWAAYDRNESCWPCQWGTVSGISEVQPGEGLEILPAFIAQQSSSLNDPRNPTSGLSSGDLLGDLSLAAKYSLSSHATLEGAYNPDFSQIEADAAQVDVNTTIALFYPERRPFFQEGSDVFRTMFNSFYTRTVNDPEYAVKFVNRGSAISLGFMTAQDETSPYLLPLDESSELFVTGRSWVNVLRGAKSFGEASQIGFMATDRRLESGGYGTILSADAAIRLSQTYAVDGQFLRSFTGEPDKAGGSASVEGVLIDNGRHTAVFDGESFSGNAFITRLNRNARVWGFQMTYSQVDPTYRTLTGYDPWVNYRDVHTFNRIRFNPTSGLFTRIEPQLYVNARWRHDGVLRWENQHLTTHFFLRWAQSRVTVIGYRGSSNWTSSLTGKMVAYDDLYGLELQLVGRPGSTLGYAITLERDRSVARHAEATGDQNSVRTSVTFKPWDRLLIEPHLAHVRSTHVETGQELFRQLILRGRLQYQVSPRLSVRLVVQYNDAKASILVGERENVRQYYAWERRSWDIDPLITYRINSFSVLYAGSAHDYLHYADSDVFHEQWRLSSRQYFVKLQYLFQV